MVESNSSLIQRAFDYLKTLGASPVQAAGIVANLNAESGLKVDAFNGAGGGNGAQGIEQWRGTRLADFNSWAQNNGAPTGVTNATLEQQLSFAWYELTQGKEKGNAMNFFNATDVGGASRAFTLNIERPDAAQAHTIADTRANSAAQIFNVVNSKNNTSSLNNAPTPAMAAMTELTGLNETPGQFNTRVSGLSTLGQISNNFGIGATAIGNAAGGIVNDATTNIGNKFLSGGVMVFGAVLIIVAILVYALKSDIITTTATQGIKAGALKASGA